VALRPGPNSPAKDRASAQSAAQRDQIWQQAQRHDWTTGVDIATRAALTCPSCGSKTAGGKFCASCGASLAIVAHCPGCGFDKNAQCAVFCSECGSKL
jgi:hypothetical protein